LKPHGALYIWLTCVLKAGRRYVEHPNRFTQAELEAAVNRNGFKVADVYVEPFIGISRHCLAVSSGNTVFMKACKKEGYA